MNLIKLIQQALCTHSIMMGNGKFHHRSNEKNLFRLECKFCNKYWIKTGLELTQMGLKPSNDCVCEYHK